MGGIKLRYGLYGLISLCLGIAYYVLDNTDDTTQTLPVDYTSRKAEELPFIHVPMADDETKVKRDIFAFLAPPEVVSIRAPEPVAEQPAVNKTDRFADLHILGIVSQDGERAILVRAGEKTFTILQDQRFGEDNALNISGIKGHQIDINDNISGISKTFLLSEE